MYAVRVKPEHPIGIRHRAGIGFSRDVTFLEEVPQAVHDDEWLEVRDATEEELERLAREPLENEDSSLSSDEDPQDENFAQWVVETSVMDIMAHVEEAESLGNHAAAEKILAIEQTRGDDARKTLITQLEEIIATPSESEGNEDPEGS